MICWYALLLISHYGLLKIWPWNFQEIIWALLQFIVMLKFSSKPHRAVTVGLLNDTRWWFGGQTSSPKSVCMYFWQSLSFTPPPLALARGKQTYSTAPLWLWLGGQTSNPKSVSMYFWQSVSFIPLWLAWRKRTLSSGPLWLWLGGQTPNPKGGRGIHSLELISCWFIMAGGMNFRD